MSVYDKLTYVLLGLAVLILITSWLRKRLFQGITLALYGLAIFQLHYTYFGFAAPFLLAGAWYLVRAYRLQQELKLVRGGRSERAPPQGQHGHQRDGAAAPAQQALHAAFLSRSRPRSAPDAGARPGAGGAGPRGAPRARRRCPRGSPAPRTRPSRSARWRRWRPVTPARDRPARRWRPRWSRGGGTSRPGAARRRSGGRRACSCRGTRSRPRWTAPAEEAHAARHGEGDRHAVIVQAVVLLVRVHADDGEDDGQDGERRQHDAEHDLTDAPAVHLDPGAAQLPDAVAGLAAALPAAVRGGGGHRDRAIVVAAPRGRPARPGPRATAGRGSLSRPDRAAGGLTRSKHSGDDAETPGLHCVGGGENRPKWISRTRCLVTLWLQSGMPGGPTVRRA